MTERVFTPRDSSGNRLRWHLSDTDWIKVKRGRRWTAVVTNLNDGKTYKVKGASCGSPHCFCDALVLGEAKNKS